MRVAVAFIGLLAGLAVVFLAAGCSNGRTADDLYGFDPRLTPEAFSVSLTVMNDERSGLDDPAMRSARYIVEADGILRASIGSAVTPESFPPIIRRLDDRQVAGLWAIVDRTGMLRDPDPARVGNPDLVSRRQGRAIAVAWARAGERTRASSFEFVPRDPHADRIEPLVRELARLAWVDR